MTSDIRRRGRWLAAGLCAPLLASACTLASAENPVVFAGTGGSMNEALRTAAFEPLREREGVTVLDDSPNNEAKLKAMVDSKHPTWDVFYSSPYRSIAMCGKLFEKIDYSVVDRSALDPSTVSPCGVPFIKSAFLLVYNRKKYGDHPPRSWADYYDTRRFPGRRGIMNYAKDAGMETALLADGVRPDRLYPLDYPRAFRKLDTIRKDLTFFTTGAQQTQALETGQIDMMLAWPGRAYDAKRNGADLGVTWNGALRYSDTLSVVKGSKHKDRAMRLINQIVSAPAQTALAQALPYTPANTAARPAPTPLLREFMPSYHTGGTVVSRDNGWWARNLEEATRQWTTWANS